MSRNFDNFVDWHFALNHFLLNNLYDSGSKDKLSQLIEKSLDSLYSSFRGLVCFHESQLSKDRVKMFLNISWKFLVFSFMSANINVDSYSCIFRFTDFMDILENLNNLRHDNNFLDYFFNDIGHLDKFLLSGSHSNRNMLYSINNLQNFFNIVDISNNFFEFLSIN